MSTAMSMQESSERWAPPHTAALDEAVWQAWLDKHNRRERRASAHRLRLVKWVCAATLLVAAAFWNHLAPYDVVGCFIVTAGSLAVMFELVDAKLYLFSIAFGVLAILFNPVVPVVRFTGDWQRAIALGAAVPFAAVLHGPTPGRRPRFSVCW